MAFNITPNIDVQRDPLGRVQQITHMFEPFAAAERNLDRGSLAEAYLHEVSDLYGIDHAWMKSIQQAPSRRPEDSGTELREGEEKELHGTVTRAYSQTHMGIPVWEAGLALTMQTSPLRVVSSHSTLHEHIDADSPDEDAPFAPGRLDQSRLAKMLGLDRRSARELKINSTGWRVFLYSAEDRFHPEIRLQAPQRALKSGKSSAPPSLDLPDPVGVEEGRHYFVTEVLFTLPVAGWGSLNWRALVEIRTGAVLYLRALVACVDGQVFARDPQSRSNNPAVVATATDAVLNPWRQAVTLSGLTVPAAGTQQGLTGEFVTVSDVDPPTAAPPTLPAGSDFNFDARSDGFAATNAYYLVDGMFRLMQSMGFTIAGPSGYFNGTTFPVPVDHKGMNGTVNAQCPGDAQGDGIGRFSFGPCVSGTTVGMCTEFQTVAHEFGHALLHDAVHSPNFGFCHSAGDSLATILADVDSALTGTARFQVFPWCPIGGSGERFCNRDVAGGWAWGGTRDDRGYGSEQVLATTLFRVYQATGGDSTHPDAGVRRATKLQAARYTTYLIFRSIGSLATNPVTATPNVGVYASALMTADTGTASFDSIPGGTHNKVLRWSFERQGLYQPAGAATLVTAAGAPPPVDVYIDDGRGGGYMPYLENFWETTDIWNLTAANPATTPSDHTTPILGAPNFCYVRVRNRGTQTANNVVVRAYHNRPSTGLMWPGDWQAMTTAVLPAPGSPTLSIPPGGMVTVGPFEWTPQTSGHECLLAWVSADGDRANIDPAAGYPCAAGPTPHWRFVPFDNNVAQRNVAPVPARSAGFRAALENRRIWIENPSENSALVRVEVELPPFLKRLRWGVAAANAEQGEGMMLKAGERRQVRLSLRPGQEFTPEEILRAKGGRRIRVRTIVDGIVTGGITFEVDPRMLKPPREKRR